MGACTFETQSKGKTAAEAFDAAVAEAQYAFGHAGYTGSIAEKRDFVMIPDRPKAGEDVDGLIRRLIDDSDPRIDDKWGPAGCIQLPDETPNADIHVYVFFGWASE